MLENIKKLISEMDSKTDFVSEVCDYYGMSQDYVKQNWFQARWKIPTDNLPKIIEMAQNYLFAQNQRQREVLKETGFEFKTEN